MYCSLRPPDTDPPWFNCLAIFIRDFNRDHFTQINEPIQWLNCLGTVRSRIVGARNQRAKSSDYNYFCYVCVFHVNCFCLSVNFKKMNNNENTFVCCLSRLIRNLFSVNISPLVLFSMCFSKTITLIMCCPSFLK
jgi:hypothetical protein